MVFSLDFPLRSHTKVDNAMLKQLKRVTRSQFREAGGTDFEFDLYNTDFNQYLDGDELSQRLAQSDIVRAKQTREAYESAHLVAHAMEQVIGSNYKIFLIRETGEITDNVNSAALLRIVIFDDRSVSQDSVLHRVLSMFSQEEENLFEGDRETKGVWSLIQEALDDLQNEKDVIDGDSIDTSLVLNVPHDLAEIIDEYVPLLSRLYGHRLLL